jgi:hypothetical protein
MSKSRLKMTKRGLSLRNVAKMGVACLAVVMMCVSCDKNNGNGKNVQLNKTELTLRVGETETLIASNANNKDVTWTSSNSFVATVMPNGLVTALSLGKTTIVATSSNGTSATCEVSVNTGLEGTIWKGEGGGTQYTLKFTNYIDCTLSTDDSDYSGTYTFNSPNIVVHCNRSYSGTVDGNEMTLKFSTSWGPDYFIWLTKQ